MITEDAIRRGANLQSFSRGEDYYRSGAVGSLVRRGDVVTATVAGSALEPYRVTVTLRDANIISASCTCPYDWGGYCKHVIAVLLALAREPGGVEERPTVDRLLADLDADSLRRLLGDLLFRHLDLIAWVEAQLALQSRQAPAGTAEGARARPSVDVKAIRRLVRSIMRAPGDYYATSGVVAGLDDVLQQACQALDAGDGEAALAVVEIIAEETIPGWEEHDDSDGEFGGWFSFLGEVAAEALLTASLTAAERDAWARKLETWQAELDDYGVDEAFDAAIAAAEQGWDWEPLRRVLAGEIDEGDAWLDEVPWFAAALTTAWLNVLERQGRIEEFLRLAEAEGQVERYTTVLVQAGRTKEAVEYGLRRLAAPGQALALAAALQARGDDQAALRVGEHGLGLTGGPPAALARWLRDSASAHGQRALALRAARAAFEADATLADFQAVRELAGGEWAGIRAELLAHLAARQQAFARTDIYLAEGLVDEAIRAAEAQPYVGHEELARIAGAAWRSHPGWVIALCRRQAEPIMDGARSKYYASAVGWLELACKAYQAAGREDEWRAYCEELIARHARKHSLVPQLRFLLRS